MKSVRVPLVGNVSNRLNSLSYDCLLKNVYAEKSQNHGIETFWVQKRPGLTEVYNNTDGEGRGIYQWNGNLYHVIDDDLYKNGVSLATLTSSSGTGVVQFTEIQGGTPAMIIKADNNLYSVTSGDTVTRVTDADLITTFLGSNNLVPGVANLDGYLFVARTGLSTTGGLAIQSTNANDAATWGTAAVFTPSLFPDPVVGITRYLNYLVLAGEWSMEFWYNAGNATGAVVSEVEGAIIPWGCAEGATIAQQYGMLFFVGQQKNGQKTVISMRGMDWQSISIPAVDRLLQAETTFSDCYGYCIDVNGHPMYCLNLVSTDVTLLYDVASQLWYTWTFDNGTTETYFKMVGATRHAGEIYTLHASTGQVFKFSPTTYQDNSQDINVKIVTDKLSFGSYKPKRCARVGFNGDRTSAASTINLRYTDDDYNTWSTARTLDISKRVPITSRWGQFTERAWEITYTGNYPFRAEALELDIEVGDYARGIN